MKFGDMKLRHSVTTAIIVLSTLSGMTAMPTMADDLAPAPMPEVMDPTANHMRLSLQSTLSLESL